MADKPIISNGFFVPSRLVGKLAGMARFPAAFVEAPSGFGKTTAVREYLKSVGARSLWHTCVGEPAEKSWRMICALIAECAPEAGASLAALGCPSRLTLADAVAIAHGIAPERETFIVIDNYQLFRSPLRREIMEVLSMHSGKLHIVFVSQPLDFFGDALGWGNIRRISAKDFLFDRESTAQLCRLCFPAMDDESIDTVWHASGGWAAAIRLQAENCRDCGEFARYEEISQLIDASVWRKLGAEERRFLMTAALPGSLPLSGAELLAGSRCGMMSLLVNNPFIVYSEGDSAFHVHELMRRFMRERLDVCSREFKDEALGRAAAVCAGEERLFEAARLYAQADDCDAVLSLPFSTQYFDGADKDTVAFFADLCDRCSPDLLSRHHGVLPILAYQFFKNGQTHSFSRLKSLMKSLTEDGSPLEEGDLQRLRGEYELILSFAAFNDIAEMSAHHRRAYEALKAVLPSPRSAVFSRSVSVWTWSVPSVLSLFWRDVGGLDACARLMDDALPLYSELTGGHGSGGASLMRAETLLNRGEGYKAAALCRLALSEARAQQQWGNCICAEYTLGRAAILLGDRDLLAEARSMVEKEAFEGRLRGVLSQMGETALYALDVVCGDTSSASPRLNGADNICRAYSVQEAPFAFARYAQVLLREKRHAELHRICELGLSLSEKQNYLLPRLYLLICRAGAVLGEGNRAEAERLFAEALTLALSDRVYLPFAENYAYIAPLIESAAVEAQTREELLTLGQRFAAGVKAAASTSREGQALTPRQREIALLLREGFSAKETAARLFVAESTVTSARRIIYEKLGIHSRAELTKMEI